MTPNTLINYFMKSKILIINPYMAEGLWRKNKVDVAYTYKNFNLFDRVFKVIFSKFLSLNFFDRKNWWKDCKGYDTIILFDSTKDSLSQSRIIEDYVASDTQLIFYMANPASFTPNLELFSKKWDMWTFSKKDSLKYGFKFGETFYFKEFSQNKSSINVKYDSFFIGLEKGRMSYLNEIKKQYANLGLSSLFYIVNNRKAFFDNRFKKRLDYNRVVDLIASSHTITEVVQSGQQGLTLRVMESIFLKKKLITNNHNIKNRQIYNPNNIFILEEDNINDLPLFISQPFQDIDAEIVDSYSFSSWIKRIINNVEFEKDINV